MQHEGRTEVFGEMKMPKLMTILTAILASSLSGCGYNTFQTTDEPIKASWSEVLNWNQRRADRVPNLVNTVNGEAKFEQDTFTRVIEARSKATSIQATPELINDPAEFLKCQQARGELSGVRSFSCNWTAMALGYQQAPNFAAENEKEISRPPSVNGDAVPVRPKGGTSGATK